jgi:hypothetical protein
MVRQEDQCLAGLWIFEANTPEMLRVTAARKRSIEGDGLVADDACNPVAGSRVNASCVGVRLRPSDKERTRLIEREQPLEIEIRPVHHVEGAGLGDQRRASILPGSKLPRPSANPFARKFKSTPPIPSPKTRIQL